MLYANASGRAAGRRRQDEPTELDRWILSRLQATVAIVGERLADFDATGGGRPIAEFVDDLSNWYVRRSRPRFWRGEAAAFSTLHHCLVTVAQLLAPFCPFLADEIYDNLDGARAERPPLRLPAAGSRQREPELEQRMAIVRQTVQMGHAARAQTKLKVRQPLRSAIIVATGEERAAIESFTDLVRDELNVHELQLRLRGRRARRGRAQAGLPPARPPLRQGHADGGRRGRRSGRGAGPRRRCATVARSGSTSAAPSTRSPPRT